MKPRLRSKPHKHTGQDPAGRRRGRDVAVGVVTARQRGWTTRKKGIAQREKTKKRKEERRCAGARAPAFFVAVRRGCGAHSRDGLKGSPVLAFTSPEKRKGSLVLAFTSPEKRKGSPARAFCLPEKKAKKSASKNRAFLSPVFRRTLAACRHAVRRFIRARSRPGARIRKHTASVGGRRRVLHGMHRGFGAFCVNFRLSPIELD